VENLLLITANHFVPNIGKEIGDGILLTPEKEPGFLSMFRSIQNIIKNLDRVSTLGLL